MYQVTYKLFFELFKESKISLARSIALSIDGDKHQTWLNDSASLDPDFKRLNSYLESILKQEEYSMFLYTINFLPDKNSFLYTLSGNKMERDTFWCETPYFAFNISTDREGKIYIQYDDEKYYDQFETIDSTLENKFHFFLREANGYKTLFLEEKELFQILSINPMIVKIPTGKEINQKDSAGEGFILIRNKEISYSVYLASKGDLDLYPGMPVVNSNIEDLKKILENGVPYSDEEFKRESYGNFFTVRVPIFSSLKKAVGLVEMNFSEKQIIRFRNSVRNIVLTIAFFTFFFTIIVSFFLSSYFSKPIKDLMDSTEQLASGDYNHRIANISKDEFGALANSFNNMASEIENFSSTIMQTNEAMRRFVPEQFLKFLNKQNISEINLGDQIQREMTILFSDIRSFTSISEKMSPQETFRFLNSYLEHVGPVIRRNNGFIDKYIGDGIMALFPGEPEDALKAAIEMQEEVALYNIIRVKDKREPISIGVGLHTGKLILGTIGEKERMDSTVISDSVNLASRIESLTKYYSSQILLSSTTADLIQNPFRYHIRIIDRVKVKGKEDPILIVEALDGLDKTIRDFYILTRVEFEAGMFAYTNKDFETAKSLFENVIEKNPHDTVAKIYLDRTKQYLSSGVSETWEAVETMSEK